MERRVAQGRPPDRPADRAREPDADASRRWVGIGGALGFGRLALFAYSVGDEGTRRLYNTFVWQAVAFLDGRAAIDYPVASAAGHVGNAFFQDVMPVPAPSGEPTAFGLIPFPPLPALILVPFVAVWGLDTDHRAIAGLFGAVDVMLAWWMLGRLPIGTPARAIGQFGYRFSNDFVPFALPLVALGAERLRRVPLVTGVLLGASIAVNLWGAIWRALFRW